MIGKIKITQAQADEIKDIRGIAYAIDIHSFNKRPDKAIAGLSTADLARALLIGYEVEPEYKVGDWILITEECGHKNRAYKIHHFAEGFANLDHENGHRSYWPLRDFRLATPEEIKFEKKRRVWAKLGRNVGEFRIGDVRILDDGNSVRITDVDYARAKYIQGSLKGFFPVESFISFEDGESND